MGKEQFVGKFEEVFLNAKKMKKNLFINNYGSTFANIFDLVNQFQNNQLQSLPINDKQATENYNNNNHFSIDQAFNDRSKNEVSIGKFNSIKSFVQNNIEHFYNSNDINLMYKALAVFKGHLTNDLNYYLSIVNSLEEFSSNFPRIPVKDSNKAKIINMLFQLTKLNMNYIEEDKLKEFINIALTTDRTIKDEEKASLIDNIFSSIDDINDTNFPKITNHFLKYLKNNLKNINFTSYKNIFTEIKNHILKKEKEALENQTNLIRIMNLENFKNIKDN
jgi:hypothetical protein